MWENRFKPIFDFVLAFTLLIFALPVLVVTSILIFVKMGRPIFFSQKRPGKNGKIFTIYKFRTMTNEKDQNGELLPDEKRLVGIGKLIRSLSIDELPQLLNILSGEMSFIGPRPLLVEYLDLYNKTQNKRHNVLPGITGWAQINGRNQLNWSDRFNFDVWYVNNISFLLDLKIIYLTIVKVIKKDGISSSGSATMEKFAGNPIFIYGASGHGKVVAEIAILNGYTIKGFIDQIKDKEIMGFCSITFEEYINEFKNTPVALGIGSNFYRKKCFQELKRDNIEIKTLIHPKAVISKNVTFEDGVVVMANATINCDCIIKKGVIVNTSATIDHDCFVDEFAHIAPNSTLAGNVSVGRESFVGAGAIVIQGCKICDNVTLGAGGVVVSDINKIGTYVGVPIKRLDE